MAPSEETNIVEAMQLKHVEEEQDGLFFALNMVSSATFPLAVKTANELGIFDIMAKEGEGAKLSAQDITEKLGIKNPQAPTMLDRILRLLASHSMLSSCLGEEGQNSGKRLYSLTYASKYFVSDADGVSFGASLNLILGKVCLDSWTELKGAIAEGGIAFNRVHGMNAFEYSAVDPTYNDVFNKAMFNITTIITNRVLELYDGFKNINRLVDVGGGLGINLKLITSKYPNLQGVNFDLPHVIEHAPTYPGVEHVAGDMFESVPNGDAIFMKASKNQDVYKRQEHAPTYPGVEHVAGDIDGKVIVVDLIVPALPESTVIARNGYQADILMMAQNPGGKERTQNEFMELALSSGFSGITFVCFVSGFWVMEFYK
ncbi:flavonol 3-O-methyltransferase [Vigna unguiculata]|uniref:Flavonol 3-O-methyltransferase n=1 Tax=Vigna unguiculata TaxID=3917 RepID=A0A4D6MLM7_VIGUN|nr:flavonol 3-O-methyltransferase [Vigna unguiculata]